MLLELTILIRVLYFLKHNCHNMVARVPFFADHEFLGSSYQMSLDQYDGLIERMIGLGETPDLMMIQSQAIQKLQQAPLSYKENSECFQAILSLNKHILSVIEVLCKSGKLSQGTIQLIGGYADQIEVENYKLGQRIKK